MWHCSPRNCIIERQVDGVTLRTLGGVKGDCTAAEPSICPSERDDPPLPRLLPTVQE